jgi:hypothetical protein
VLSPHFIDMMITEKQQEMTRNAHEIRLARTAAARRPSFVRQSIASAIVRFGVFLDAGAYHCPGPAAQR